MRSLAKIGYISLIIFALYFIMYTYNYVPVSYKFYVAFGGGMIFSMVTRVIKNGLRL